MSATLETNTDTRGAVALLRSGGLWSILPVVLAIVALYPILSGELVYDDLWLVAQNPAIRNLASLPDALTGAYWDFLDPEEASRIGYWRPLTTIALWLGYAIGGGAPWSFHAVSLALHVAAVCAAWTLARRLSDSVWVATATAALFAVHPVQVEPVAWISSVNDPLHGLCCLFGLDAWLRWRARGSAGLPWLAALWFLIGLFAKENAVAFVPLVLGLDLGRRRESRESARLVPAGRLRGLVPVLGALALYLGLRLLVFDDVLAGFDRVTSDLRLSAGRMALLRVELLGGFLGLLVWPEPLNLFRDIQPVIREGDHHVWEAAGWIATWAIATATAAKLRARPALTALLILPAGVIPALIRLESIGRFPLSERFLYTSVFGFALLVALLARRWLPRAVAALPILAIVGIYAVRSHARTAVWHDERALFQAGFEASPNSPYVAWGQGRVLLDSFRESGDPDLLARAGAAFSWSQGLGLPDPKTKTRDESIFVTPEDRLQANLGMGWFYLFSALIGYETWTFDDAELVFGTILDGFPDSEEAYVGRAVARMRLGNDFGAREDLDQAIAINELHPEAWYYSGDLYAQQGQPLEAAGAYERFLELRPDDSEALCLYAGALAEAGRGGAARKALERARALAPEDPSVSILEGVLAAREQRYEDARRHFDAALRLAPTNAEAWRQKGKVLLQTGDAQGGFDCLRRACQFDPMDFEAHYNLGALLIEAGQGAVAIPYLERAAEVATDPELRTRLEEQLQLLREAPEEE